MVWTDVRSRTDIIPYVVNNGTLVREVHVEACAILDHSLVARSRCINRRGGLGGVCQ